MSGSLLDAGNLTVHFGQRKVLDRVSLRIGSGDFVGLIGPNGAGKTTLLRSVLGLVGPSTGRVLVEGRPVARVRGDIGYVPQRHEFAWDFPISVADAVLTGRTRKIGWLRRPSKSDRAVVELALDRAGLADLRLRPIGELSGGQRQRVLVARALATQPRLLLLDEPFSAVDLPTQELLTELLSGLAREGCGLLMATHDLAAAVATCTRLCLLNGTVVAEGSPEELSDPELLLRAFGVAVPVRAVGSFGDSLGAGR